MLSKSFALLASAVAAVAPPVASFSSAFSARNSPAVSAAFKKASPTTLPSPPFPLSRLSSPSAPAPATLSSSSSALQVLPESVVDPESARTYFFLWFFGGSGGGGVALGQFPAQFAKFSALRAKASDGSLSKGGDTIGISPLCLYPRDLYASDLEAVLSKFDRLTVERAVEVGPKPNYMSERGYLCFQSFEQATEGCDPLTVRAVFDALSTGDNAQPEEAQMALDSFRSKDDAGSVSSGTEAFKSALLKTKLSGFSSIVFLLFLLGPIVGSTCLEAGAFGWFPEWPGRENLPWSLIVGDGFWTIPQYWI